LINIKPEADLIGHRVRMLDEPLGPEVEDLSTLPRKVRFLNRPDSYIPTPEAVTARETHISWVFMASKQPCLQAQKSR
jgi:hypothetical protein